MLSYLSESVGIRGIPGAHHQHYISLLCQILYCALAVLSGVADVIKPRSLNSRETGFKLFNSISGFINAQGSLSYKGVV